MVSRMDHYLPLDRSGHPMGLSVPNATDLPRQGIRDYVKSGRIFIAAEADDRMIGQLFELVGEDHVLFSSDFPPRRGTRERGGNPGTKGFAGEPETKTALRQHRVFVG